MGLFVRVEQATLAEGSAPELLFVGQLFAIKAACVTDVILADAPRAREFARIVDYPQWTESGLALFLRLLRLSGPIPELADVAAGRVTVTLTDEATGRVPVEFPDGRIYAMEGSRESLHIDVQPRWLECSLISLEAIVADMHVIASQPVRVQDAIGVGLAGALGWGQFNRPVPRPLSSIGIRRSEVGEECVLLRDIPTLPRHYLSLYLSLPRRARAVAATDWRAFLHALSCRSDISLVQRSLRHANLL